MNRERRYLWRGLALGLILSLLALGGLYLAGFHLMRHEPTPTAKEEPTPKPLCYVSPKNPDYIRFEPGQDPEGAPLLPVYPTKPPAPGTPPAEKQMKYWVSPMDPTFVRTQPGKDPMGMDLVPVYGELGQPAKPAATAKGERKIKYWVSPMDPGYVRDKPGKAPCGMDMVPVYEEVGEAAGAGGIAVSPTTVQSMGVRTAKAEVKLLSRVTRAVGLVTYNERNLAAINTKVNGWVEKLYVNATGDPVRRGQTLLSIYSPELVSAQEEYLLAWRNLQSLGKSPVKEMAEGAQRLAQAARRRLDYFDITPSQIETLKNTGQVKKNLVLMSPANGIVAKRMVTQGMYVQAGMPLMEVADLSTVWVDAEIYQFELPWIKVGQPVTMTLEYLPGETFPGTIDYIYPYLKEATRTAKVRLRFPNPKLELKPQMFAQVTIESPAPKETVVVPSEAVLDTGVKQHVFIALGGGRFEPRQVKLGMEGNDGLREVLSGLQGGEEVVTSAQFLLDSESRFREAIQMMLAPQPQEGKPGAAPAPSPPPMPPGHKH
jgi:Cu(I)/Ag(I) efflux system membrane fusion protein/cobalt-zinc-cadmium efflux system membrane fusion protein